MNIHTAAIYMNQGYRIRRPEWPAGQFLVSNKHGYIERTHLLTSSRMTNGQYQNFTFEVSDSLLDLTISDLLADDWELIEVSNEKTS